MFEDIRDPGVGVRVALDRDTCLTWVVLAGGPGRPSHPRPAQPQLAMHDALQARLKVYDLGPDDMEHLYTIFTCAQGSKPREEQRRTPDPIAGNTKPHEAGRNTTQHTHIHESDTRQGATVNNEGPSGSPCFSFIPFVSLWDQGSRHAGRPLGSRPAWLGPGLGFTVDSFPRASLTGGGRRDLSGGMLRRVSLMHGLSACDGSH